MSVHLLDVGKLSNYLAERVCEFDQITRVDKFSGGQSNPTFKISTSERSYVLRCKPVGELLKSAHAVDREFRVIGALAGTDIPVPKVYILCEDEAIIGSMFYLMEYVEGRIFWDPALPDVGGSSERAKIYDAMNQTLATLHNVDIETVGLADYGRPGNYFGRQVGRWSKQYFASETAKITAMDTLIKWLPLHIPEDDNRVSLVHGDYRLDNMIFHPTESKVIALLDWELSTLGHPLADLANQCMVWMLAKDGVVKGLRGVDRQFLGIPSDEEYIAKYCQRTGRNGIDNWSFYLAFSLFRLAAIAQGVAKRVQLGSASSAEADARGALVEPLAEMALQLIAGADY